MQFLFFRNCHRLKGTLPKITKKFSKNEVFKFFINFQLNYLIKNNKNKK